MSRDEQREQTQGQIVEAAFNVFSEQGFDGASTRAIASTASVSQALLMYHFPTKQDLWKAAVDHLFATASIEIIAMPAPEESADRIEHSRAAIRSFVRFLGRNPQLFRFMIDTGENATGRRKWLIDTHLKAVYEEFAATIGASLGAERDLIPHFFYLMVGAGSLIFAIGDEVEYLTGLDVTSNRAVNTHAELVARILLPFVPGH